MPADAPYPYRGERAEFRRYELFRNGRHVMDSGGIKIAAIDKVLHDLVIRNRVQASTITRVKVRCGAGTMVETNLQ